MSQNFSWMLFMAEVSYHGPPWIQVGQIHSVMSSLDLSLHGLLLLQMARWVHPNVSHSCTHLDVIPYNLHDCAIFARSPSIMGWCALGCLSVCKVLGKCVFKVMFLSSEDGVMQEMDMLGYEILKSERSLIYILTLGVIQPYRNSGIGEHLPFAWCQDMSLLCCRTFGK